MLRPPPSSNLTDTLFPYTTLFLSVGPYSVRFDAVRPIAGPNWTAIEATLTARRGDGDPFILRPQARMFSSPPTETSEAAIETQLDGQLYTVLGKGRSEEHTSELQSLMRNSYAVFCLKKKNT